ncbi:50S ribosomal protein L29 [Campylobacterota bacterium]|nr:50S ribosomal protein L29 [Campylobacterota bacterium]
MKYSEIKSKSREDLLKDVKEKKLQLFSLRMKQKTMQLSNTNEIRTKRKEIAQTLTALSAIENGEGK